MSNTLLFGLAAVCGTVVAVRSGMAAKAGRPYVFHVWEGLLFRGKQLSPEAARTRSIVYGIAALGSLLLVTRVVPFSPTYGIVMSALVAAIIHDFVSAKKIPVES